MDIVVEGQDFTCSRISPPLLFISKANGMLCLLKQNFTIERTLANFCQFSQGNNPDPCHTLPGRNKC